SAKTTPWRAGIALGKFPVAVCRRMYAFHASEPDSRPPPVSFSPPHAPPISAPLVPMFLFANPQSEPAFDRSASAALTLVVKMDDDKPCGTPLCAWIASSTDLN